jgi:hypothetical protein
MLCFGNFRFAFRQSSDEQDPTRFMESLEPWTCDSAAEKAALQSRQVPLLGLTGTADEIPQDKTWLLGYLSSNQLEADRDAISSQLELEEARGPEAKTSELRSAYDTLKVLDADLKLQRATGRRNTVKYLTWDHLDVYVATSMRQRWEFEETFGFVKDVFQGELSDLSRVRWFDPTQSYCDSLIDKGLVEALMLKRAKCTIYMAQEGDTLGKDSELAATLAQGKPVIAYVPRIDGPRLKTKAAQLERRPLAYYRQRLLTLSADGFFDRSDNRSSVAERAQQVGMRLEAGELKARVQDLLQLVALFERERHYFVIDTGEAAFRDRHRENLADAPNLLSAIESVAADTRASTIKTRHPLGMQVHLETGVANGVLVARSAKECASLIRGILTRDFVFDIERVTDPKTTQELGTALVDLQTSSRFRFVTKDECLTNSFWNFYLEKEAYVHAPKSQ